jgi:hypothetical protein
MTNTVSGMQRRRDKMFGSSPYVTVLDDFDFGLSRQNSLSPENLKNVVREADVLLKDLT